MNKKIILAATMCMAMFFASGCLSYIGTQAHNNRVDKQVIQVQASQDGKGAVLAVNLLELSKGYFGAWSAAPGTMAAATIGDLLVTGGAAYLLLNKNGGGGDNGKDHDRAVVQVNGDGNTTYINSGDGNQTTTTSSGDSAESTAE